MLVLRHLYSKDLSEKIDSLLKKMVLVTAPKIKRKGLKKSFVRITARMLKHPAVLEKLAKRECTVIMTRLPGDLAFDDRNSARVTILNLESVFTPRQSRLTIRQNMKKYALF